MYELIIMACLAYNLGCKEFHDTPQFKDLYECSSTSPGFVAVWSESHPSRTIKYWRCQPLSGVEENL